MSFIEYWLPPLILLAFYGVSLVFWLLVQWPILHYSDKELDIRNLPFQLLASPYRIRMVKDRYGDLDWEATGGQFRNGYRAGDAFDSYIGAACGFIFLRFMMYYVLYVIGLLYWPLLAFMLLWYGFMKLFQMVWRMKRKVDANHS